MSLAIVYSRAQLGVQALLISVEVHIANGLPSLTIVGLPEAAVRESRERVAFVIDGDTVRLAGGERIRLLGIDAPEMRKGKPGRLGPFPEPGAVEATEALREMVEGRVVVVRRRGTDDYGRTLAKLRLEDGVDVGAELVRRGLATRYAARQ